MMTPRVLLWVAGKDSISPEIRKARDEAGLKGRSGVHFGTCEMAYYHLLCRAVVKIK